MDQNYREFSTPPSQRCQRNNEDLANHTSNLIPSYSKRLWWIGVDIEMVSTLIAFFIQKFVRNTHSQSMKKYDSLQSCCAGRTEKILLHRQNHVINWHSTCKMTIRYNISARCMMHVCSFYMTNKQFHFWYQVLTCRLPKHGPQRNPLGVLVFLVLEV